MKRDTLKRPSRPFIIYKECLAKSQDDSEEDYLDEFFNMTSVFIVEDTEETGRVAYET